MVVRNENPGGKLESCVQRYSGNSKNYRYMFNVNSCTFMLLYGDLQATLFFCLRVISNMVIHKPSTKYYWPKASLLVVPLQDESWKEALLSPCTISGSSSSIVVRLANRASWHTLPFPATALNAPTPTKAGRRKQWPFGEPCQHQTDAYHYFQWKPELTSLDDLGFAENFMVLP